VTAVVARIGLTNRRKRRRGSGLNDRATYERPGTGSPGLLIFRIVEENAEIWLTVLALIGMILSKNVFPGS